MNRARALEAGLDRRGLRFRAGPLQFGPGVPALTIDGARLPLRPDRHGARWRGRGIALDLNLGRESRTRIRVTATLRNERAADCTLNRVALFIARGPRLGPRPGDVRVLEQDAYNARVRSVRQMITGSDGLRPLGGAPDGFASQTLTAFFDPGTRTGLLIAFESLDRWLPRIAGQFGRAVAAATDGMENVDGGRTGAKAVSRPARVRGFRQFRIEFAGGDLTVLPGETVSLGDFVVEAGADPLELLDDHARRLTVRHRLAPPPAPFANWCSWYPHRLGVTASKVLDQARAARRRHLGALGLRFLQVDLGWERGHLPTPFEESRRFGRLRALADDLAAEGFALGAWVGSLCIDAGHPVARRQPEWLLRGADGRPRAIGEWFWHPFRPFYGLDVSHPGARAWLARGFASLARRGVRYVKWDFAGIITGPDLRGRHDRRVINAGAREAVRLAFATGLQAMREAGTDPVLLDCSGTDRAGAGLASLSYACPDTGNTGLGWRWLREVYTAFIAHRHRRHWALLQPSCLVTGLPGTLEEARMRATATFLGAGHVDLGDDLTTLPEDRWTVITATLPPNENAARPIDLFAPIETAVVPYLNQIKGRPAPVPAASADPEGACVWVLPVRTEWDEWTLVGLFNWVEPPRENGDGVALATPDTPLGCFEAPACRSGRTAFTPANAYFFPIVTANYWVTNFPHTKAAKFTTRHRTVVLPLRLIPP